jgi:hypothetical protein
MSSIGVLTFHRCINYGSYWQARCLVEGLRALGHDAALLDHDSAAVNRAEWRCALAPALPARGSSSDRAAYLAKTRTFLAAIAALPRSSRFELGQPEQMPPCEIVVVGSDEVWNLHHPWYGGAPIFYGEGLKAGRVISYAASFGNHHVSEGLERHWADRLGNFADISVRDANSHQLVRALTARNPEIVLDPCLLFPPALAADEDGRPDAPYLALYGHGFPAWFRAAVRRWAARHGHRILSIGYRNDWADEQNIAAGPEEFAGLMARAGAVATNFFHGCVFALLNARPFICAPSAYRLNKVRDLTDLLGAARRLVCETTGITDIERLLSEPEDEEIGSRIAALRASSRQYLVHALR